MREEGRAATPRRAAAARGVPSALPCHRAGRPQPPPAQAAPPQAARRAPPVPAAHALFSLRPPRPERRRHTRSPPRRPRHRASRPLDPARRGTPEHSLRRAQARPRCRCSPHRCCSPALPQASGRPQPRRESCCLAPEAHRARTLRGLPVLLPRPGLSRPHLRRTLPPRHYPRCPRYPRCLPRSQQRSRCHPRCHILHRRGSPCT
mmetsp:Transcript_42436/g.137685  ORF Transcript_42436/g.137685 Transcript_42436/m.137685 type:complete len:205 (-) Transcript_42436:6-620(-)